MNCSKIKKIGLKTLIATVDFSKKKHMGYFRTLEGYEIKSFEFDNNNEGFHLFYRKLIEFFEKHQLTDVVLGYEPTGNYGLPFLHFLSKRGVNLIAINPKHTKRVKELNDNSPNKTDKKDPKVIADIVLLGHGLTCLIAEGRIAEMKQSVLFRETVLEDIVRVKNRIEGLLTQYFPEFLQVMKNLNSKSSIYLLEHYPTPGLILKLGLVLLTRLLKKISRGQLGKDRAEALYKAAKDTIGINEGLESMKANISHYIKQLRLLESQLQETEQEIGHVLESLPESRIISSIKGIGKITTAIILSEVVDFKKYSLIPEITKLAGLNLYERSSGRYKGQLKISKRGKSLLRKALYFATLNLVRKGGIFHEQYQQYLERGMIKNKALISLSKKILRIIFSMVRDGNAYIENYDTIKPYKTAA